MPQSMFYSYYELNYVRGAIFCLLELEPDQGLFCLCFVSVVIPSMPLMHMPTAFPPLPFMAGKNQCLISFLFRRSVVDRDTVSISVSSLTLEFTAIVV